MRTKKILNLLIVLLISLSFIFITGCSKDDNEPIQLVYAIYKDNPDPVRNNQISLLYPLSEKTQLLIVGGDNDFIISNSDTTKLKVEVKDRLIELTPLSIGDITVTINDKSNNFYTLNVNIFYRKNEFIVGKQDVVIIGDKLSTVQKKEIEQKAMLTFPVKVNGGYKLIYNVEEDINRGQAFIYKENYNTEAIESVFEMKSTEIDGSTNTYRTYIILIDGKQREFVLNRYNIPPVKSEQFILMALVEILTEQFKTDYPDVEFVYTQQLLR